MLPALPLAARIRRYAWAAGMVAAASLVGAVVAGHASLADEAMLYALAILIAAHAGRGPGLVAAALSVIAFDFLFVEPRFALAVADTRFLFTFAVMFVAGAAIGGLVVRLRAAEEASRDRERFTAALLSFTRDAAAATDAGGVTEAAAAHVRRVLDVEPAVRAADDGAIAIDLGRATLAREQQQFVEAVARQAAIAVEKLRLAAAARDAEVRATTEELRNALLSAVSHDLRTPLGAITGMATELRERAPADEREALDTIVHEAARLGRILQNLLAVTKVEAGAEPRREWMPVEELVGAALARLDETLAGRTVAVDVDGVLLAHVDPILGELLLVNLVDNAAKHTPPSAPIELSARRTSSAAVIEVADRGPGLPPGTDRLIFERFFRAAPRGTRGTGLGLAVCRGIAIVHGGTIEAIRRDGGGTVFRVVLPDAEPLPGLDELLAEPGDAPLPEVLA
jgi:two-component system sensor histidine kinase KdpD